MITVKQLVEIAPFPDDIKQELLSQADGLNSDRKLELEELCWALISTEYQNKLRYEMEKAMLDIAFSENKPGPDYMIKAEQRYLEELAQKLGTSQTEEKIEEIREKLGEINQQVTTNQDPAPSPDTTAN